MTTTITLKNIPTGLYQSLKKSALKNRRSINSEVISIIENTFLSKPIDPVEFLLNARKLRERTNNFLLTEERLNQIKNEGRS